MIPRHQFLLAFFTIALLSTSLSGYTQSAIEPNKTIIKSNKGVIELEMKPIQATIAVPKQYTQYPLRLMLPVDNSSYDLERPPWDIDILTPNGRWFKVINYDDNLLLFDFEKFAFLPYIDISIADIEGKTVSKHAWSQEKVFQESGEYRILLSENYTRHIGGYEFLEGYVILRENYTRHLQRVPNR